MTFHRDHFASFLIQDRWRVLSLIQSKFGNSGFGGFMSEGRTEQVVAKEFQENIEAIVSRYEGKAFALYELIVPGAEGAAEILASAFRSALKSFEQGTEELCLEVLLYREIIRTSVDYLDEAGCFRSEESEWEPAVLPSAASRKVDSAVHTLPIEYRIVFSLRDVLRLQTETVQQILSITELEIKAYLHRARLMLFRTMREARA